jgi:Mrp family chromosome partitioning ATPase
VVTRPRRGQAQPAGGKIVTFFSFKGGVGRTMALANCAFAAAMNGSRVLVMDWDLEAPGLPHYFRGMIDQRRAGAVRRASGVLDLFWGWQQAIDGAQSGEDLKKRLTPFRDHGMFAESVNPLVDPGRLPKSAKLDVMTAGSPLLNCPEPLSYAEALSRFNWTEFFSKRAGGSLIHQLAEWCRANYDLTLIDSRTGLADVAGICTMQIPDTVYLCFVFNRQNIEGTAQVARAISEARKGEIDVRVVPMRVSTGRPAEESDARSRAARELKRAGLSQKRIEADLKMLSIPAANVPYYEALAPFYSTENAVGDLNWGYLRLTEELLGHEIPRLALDPAWTEEVRKRLQPRITTVEYLRELEIADPDRAIEEIERFIDGALDADPSLELDSDYVRTLVTSAMDSLDRALEDDEEQNRRLAQKTLRLIEQMNLLGEGDWRTDFIEALDEFDFRIARTLEDHRELLAWQDRVLREGPQTGEILIRRANTAIMLARLDTDETDRDAALEQVFRAEELCREAEAAGSSAEEVSRARATVADLHARLILASDPEAAIALFAKLLQQAHHTDDLRVRLLGAEAHLTLAELQPDTRRAHVLAAAELEPRVVLRDINQLQHVVSLIVDEDETGRETLNLAKMLFNKDKRSRSFPAYARSTQATQQFAKITSRLLRKITIFAPDQTASIAAAIAEISIRALAQWSRKSVQLIQSDGTKLADDMIANYEALAERLHVAGLDGRSLSRLYKAIEAAKEQVDDTDG